VLITKLCDICHKEYNKNLHNTSEHKTTSVRNQPIRSTQPFIPTGQLVNRVAVCLAAGVKAGRVHLCRVAGNTVWSYIRSSEIHVHCGSKKHPRRFWL